MRLSFTSKEETVNETATFEPANQNTEQSQFVRYSTAKLVNTALFDRTNGAANGYAQRLNGSANERYGLAKSISVMPGDVIQAEVYAKYVDPVSSNWNGALATLMTQIAGGAAGVVVDGSAYATSTGSFPFAGLLSTNDTGAPRAYLNWLVFDRNYGFITGGFRQISTTAKEAGTDVAHELIAMPQAITINRPGYVYIYLSNENATPVEVFFDDFKVTHTKSPVIQAEEYYPFGLVFNSYSRENSVPNKYKFGGKEEQAELALNTIDWGWRQYDPAIGRWNVVDQWSEKYHTTSPYSFVQNNPISHREIDGRYFEGKDEKKAARIERRAEKRADKLEAKAAKIEARGGDSGDRRGRAAELRQSGQDIRDMRNDQSTQYRYAKLDGKESKALGLQGPSTTLTGQNSKGDNVVTMFTESNMGNKLHESRHGGQNARGEYNIATGASYGVADEVSAYRAQYSWSGSLTFLDLSANPTPAQLLIALQTGKNPLTTNVTNINSINPNMVNSMADPGLVPIYPPKDAQGNLIIPLNVWNSN